MEKPLISIIIHIYNCSGYLVRCLESVKDQTYHNLEILLIDDGSTDDSGRIADEYAKKDDRFHVFHQENKGVSEARNLGLSRFKGEYLTFVDGDDLLDLRYVERLYYALVKAQVPLAVCDPFNCRSEEIKEYCFDKESEPIVINMGQYDYTKPYAHKVVWGALYERRIVEGLIFCKDIYLAEDSLFFAEVLNRCEKIAYIREKRYVYILYADSASHGTYDWKKKTEVQAAKRVKEIFEDYPKRFQRKVNAWYCCVCLNGLKLMKIYDCVEADWYEFLLKEARNCLMDLLSSSCTMITKVSSVIWCIFPQLGGFIYKRLKGKKE